MPGPLDHLVAVLLLVAAPIYASRTFQKFVAEMSRSDTSVRLREYRGTILRQWLACLLLIGLWIALSRPHADLGLTIDRGTRGMVGILVTGAVLLFLAFQWRSITRLTGAALDPLRAQLEPVRAILPATIAEYRTFQVLALTAGICEEVLYRGFLIWYLGAFLGQWPAVLIGAAGFGLAHFYQGRTGILKTGIAGAITGALYVVSGSLLWPMILHAAVDLQGGAIGYRLREPPAAAAHGEAPGQA
jgi:membrane protease YdiL (CAAX protease family)